jgi:hypothetical protein
MRRPLLKVDYSELERRILAGGPMPKGLAQNTAFLVMYGGNPKRVAQEIRKCTRPVNDKD